MTKSRARTINNGTKIMAGRKQKRWYIDASVPKGVPLIGGASFKAGSGTLAKRSINAAVQKVIAKHEQVKQKVVALTTLNPLSGTLYTLNPLGNISIGSGETSRLGSEIRVKSFEISMLLQNNGTALPNGSANQPVFVRCMLLRHMQQQQGGSDTFASGLGATDLFVQGQTYPNLAQLDTDRVTILHDKMYKIPGSQITGVPSAITEKFSLDFGTEGIPFKYATSTSNYSVANKNLYVVLSVQTPGDTTGTTIPCTVTFDWNVKFYDSR